MKLDGVRVLDLSLFLPGPTVTQMMADHGADVIKVENPTGGEPNRSIGQRRGDETVYFACTHRGKRSLTLNLKDQRGVGIFLKLAQSADVVIESFRPGVVKRLGVGYDAVAAVKPDIVYASISAFGQRGPLAQNPAHDLAVQAMCGILSTNAGADGRPVMPSLPAGDMLAATLTLSGILMALFQRGRTGKGDYLDMAMMDAVFSCMPNSMGAVFAEGKPPTLDEERIWGGAAMYRIYDTRDGKQIVLGGSEMKFAENLLKAMKRPDLIALCAEPPGPAQQPVIEFFNQTFRSRTQAQWVTFFHGLDVCFAPVNNLRQGLDLEQTRLREMSVRDDQDKEHLGTPFKFLHEPADLEFHAPGLGAHTDELLESIGEDADALRAQGVV